VYTVRAGLWVGGGETAGGGSEGERGREKADGATGVGLHTTDHPCSRQSPTSSTPAHPQSSRDGEGKGAE